MKLPAEPEILARELLDSAADEWLRALVDELDREIRVRPLERLLTLWNLSNAAAGRLFGVSRQAFSKWLDKGPPGDRAADVALVDSITDLLDRNVKRERIPAVVRRPAGNLGDRSLLEALQEGDYEDARDVIREAFDIRRVQP